MFPHLLDTMSLKAEITAVYGSTEAEPIAKISRSEISEADREAMWSGRGLLAGKPDEAIQLRILRESSGESGVSVSESDFHEMSLPAKEPGEIVVCGPHVHPGYLRGIGDAETKLRVGERVWHKTGDAGYLDAQGRLWLLGRCHAKIEERGSLYPFQSNALHRDLKFAVRRWLLTKASDGGGTLGRRKNAKAGSEFGLGWHSSRPHPPSNSNGSKAQSDQLCRADENFTNRVKQDCQYRVKPVLTVDEVGRWAN